MTWTCGRAAEKFLSDGPDRIWPHRMYAGKRGGGIARNQRPAVVWPGFLRSAGSCGGLLLMDMAMFVIDTEEIDKGTLEEGFPDGRALREIRQEVDNETIARLEPRQPGTGAVYEEVDMNGETEMPKVR